MEQALADVKRVLKASLFQLGNVFLCLHKSHLSFLFHEPENLQPVYFIRQ